jgi:hypothetical protein
MSGSSKPVSPSRHKRGRRPVGESRAPEIRARLIEWKQTPESFRNSLRALAAEMGTSHQLLSFYLQRLEEWQGTEYERQGKNNLPHGKIYFCKSFRHD